MRKTIAQVTAEYLRENGLPHIAWGCPQEMDDICERCFKLGISNLMLKHPPDRHIGLLNALEGSPLFIKGKRRIVVGGNSYWNREALTRMFTLKETS